MKSTSENDPIPGPPELEFVPPVAALLFMNKQLVTIPLQWFLKVALADHLIEVFELKTELVIVKSWIYPNIRKAVTWSALFLMKWHLSIETFTREVSELSCSILMPPTILEAWLSIISELLIKNSYLFE